MRRDVRLRRGHLHQHLHGLDLVLDHHGMHGRPMHLEYGLRNMLGARGLRMVRGNALVSERHVDRIDDRRDLHRTVLVLDDDRVHGRSVCIEHGVRYVFVARRMRMVLDQWSMSERQRVRQRCRCGLYGRELVLEHVGVLSGSVRIEHELRHVRGAIRLRLVCSERTLPERQFHVVDRRTFVFRLAVGLEPGRVRRGSMQLGQPDLRLLHCAQYVRMVQHHAYLPDR